MLKKILLVGWIVMIFYFSTTSEIRVTDPTTWANATLYSSNVSLSGILNTDSQFYWGYLVNHDSYFDLGLEFYLRKIAHVLVYAMLSLLFLYNFRTYSFRYTSAWLFTIVVAFADEANQYLMEGRSGRFLDVTLDSSAAFVSLCLIAIFSAVRKKKKNLSY